MVSGGLACGDETVGVAVAGLVCADEVPAFKLDESLPPFGCVTADLKRRKRKHKKG